MLPLTDVMHHFSLYFSSKSNVCCQVALSMSNFKYKEVWSSHVPEERTNSYYCLSDVFKELECKYYEHRTLLACLVYSIFPEQHITYDQEILIEQTSETKAVNSSNMVKQCYFLIDCRYNGIQVEFTTNEQPFVFLHLGVYYV